MIVRSREKRVDQLDEELLAAELSEARDRGLVQPERRDRVGAVRRGERARPPERFLQCVGADRFRDVVVHPGCEARLAILGHDVRRHGHKAGPLRLRPPLTDPAGGVQPVQLGHLHVHQDDVVTRALERRERLVAVPRDVGGEPEPLEQAERDHLIHGVVLGEQDPERRPICRLPGRGRLGRVHADLGEHARQHVV